MMQQSTHRIALALVALLAFCGASRAEDAAKAGEQSTPQLPIAGMPTQTLARDYCDAFARNAQQARNARERAELTAMQQDISAKLKELSDKTAALQSWVDQRNAILNTATDAVIKIYTTMDPQAAATELAKLDPALASAILRKLNPKKTSAILVEMDPKQAAILVSIMTADSKLLQGEKS